MAFCGNPDKLIKKRKPRKRKTSKSTGRNAGPRHRGRPKMEYKDVIPGMIQVDQPGDMVAPWTPGIPVPMSDGMVDEMWDTHGYIQNWYNPCIREKFVGPNTRLSPITDIDGPVVTFDATFTPSMRDIVRNTFPFLDTAFLDELALRSEQKLSSVVDTTTSLANFIIELIQLCTGNVKSIERFKTIYERALAAYHKELRRLLRNRVKYVSAQWLAWNFAIKPALSDLRNIVCSVTDAYAKMKWLRDHNHKIVHQNYGRTGLEKEISWDPDEWFKGYCVCNIVKADPPGTLTNGGHWLCVKYDDIKLSYNSRSKIFLDIPDKYLDGAVGMGYLWEAMMGLHNPVGIIWEAIPFSWLIDYFLSYRSRLFQQLYDYNPYNEGVTVLGYGHSFKFSAFGKVELRTYNALVPEGFTRESIGRFQYSVYTRQAGLPFPEEATYFRVPSDWYKLSIIGAIGIGILPGRRK